jgi:hypothetical protein
MLPTSAEFIDDDQRTIGRILDDVIHLLHLSTASFHHRTTTTTRPRLTSVMSALMRVRRSPHDAMWHHGENV